MVDTTGSVLTRSCLIPLNTADAMKRSHELMTHQQYVAVLRPLLPPEAFRRNPRKLLWIALYLALVGAGYALMRRAEAWWQCALVALFIGHGIACIGFYAHDLSHKTIIPGGPALRVLETFLWMLMAVPATMWKRVHNATHHMETNTVADPDRFYLEAERDPVTQAYNTLLYANREGIRGNPLIWCSFPVYIFRNVCAALAQEKPVIVPARPTYTKAQRLALMGEVLLFFSFQAGLLAFLDFDRARFLWASPAVYLITSAIVLTYVITNHALNPLCEHTDPVAGSTSVIVPKVFDRLHTHFSHHTEHHLFPGMDSSQFPRVTEALHQCFPERFNRIPLGEAWRRLWKSQAFLD